MLLMSHLSTGMGNNAMKNKGFTSDSVLPDSFSLEILLSNIMSLSQPLKLHQFPALVLVMKF
jgi:hypothetical protein